MNSRHQALNVNTPSLFNVARGCRSPETDLFYFQYDGVHIYLIHEVNFAIDVYIVEMTYSVMTIDGK